MAKELIKGASASTDRRQPSKKLRKQVKAAFDADKLIDICEREDFSDYAQRYDLEDGLNGRKRFFYYQDNGSDILAIAHLDSVQHDVLCQVTDTAAGLLATSGALDDRLGAYVILEMLPKLGIECDWLLTTDEEICATTADEFFVDKSWNWMISFDRGGTDVVMYEYETAELRTLVEAAGARVGIGSYSDICELEHLGIAGFNWGVGYADYHSARAHAWLEDTFRMVARFVKFWQANAATKLDHVESWRRDDRRVVAGRLGGTGGGWANDHSWDWIDDDIITTKVSAANDKGDWIVYADCGHMVDLDDGETFVDQGIEFICTGCAAVHELLGGK